MICCRYCDFPPNSNRVRADFSTVYSSISIVPPRTTPHHLKSAKMRQSSTQEPPSPWVTSDQLSAHMKKCVMFAGKVQSVSNTAMTLDGGDGGRPVTVQRAVPTTVQIDQGMTILVRGFVNDDLSISESATFAPTVLSDDFGTSHS